MANRPDPLHDDSGREIRPAFLSRAGDLTIFQGAAGRLNYIDRNRYVLAEGIWVSEGLPDCKDVVVRDGGFNFWEVVPDAEAGVLQARLHA